MCINMVFGCHGAEVVDFVNLATFGNWNPVVKLKGSALTHGIDSACSGRHTFKHSGFIAVVELAGELRIVPYRNPECLSESVEAAKALSP
ncbi:hypothetical protein ICA16_05890 [Pseudomonas anatoliensis]|nr:hypothetical protein [Pseudomonas anatoliensis]MBP5955188.1 hypothetical protein [Pseudomonas anatoliensis]